MKTENNLTFTLKSRKAFNRWKRVVKNDPNLQEVLEETIKWGSLMERRIRKGWWSLCTSETFEKTELAKTYMGFLAPAILIECWKYSGRLFSKGEEPLNIKFED